MCCAPHLSPERPSYELLIAESARRRVMPVRGWRRVEEDFSCLRIVLSHRKMYRLNGSEKNCNVCGVSRDSSMVPLFSLPNDEVKRLLWIEALDRESGNYYRNVPGERKIIGYDGTRTCNILPDSFRICGRH